MKIRTRKKSLTFSSHQVRQPHLPRPPLITPSHIPPNAPGVDFSLYLSFVEQTVRGILPVELLREIQSGSPLSARKAIGDLCGQIPLIVWNDPQTAPSVVAVTLLCPSEYTSGVGRYLCDALSRWLVPGKFLNICSAQSLNFRFCAAADQKFFVQQVFLDLADAQELAIAQNHWMQLSREIRLNILAVKHARNVVAIKTLSHQQKETIIQESIASVIDRPGKDDLTLFDQMQQFLIKLTAEEKITQIKDRFSPFLEQRPKIFDRDIFNEVKQFVQLYPEDFTAMRELRHVGRLISFQFLFRKSLQSEVMASPHERHLSLKLLKVRLGGSSRTALGVLGAMNVLRENELFEERHIFEALQHILPGIKKVESSFVLDRRSHDPIRGFYIEVEKEEGARFTLDEMKELRKSLSREIKERIESVIHPVFMPRNEEEVMRNIVILSQQLKYIHDIPQVVITFDEQMGDQLSFTVILLRLLHSNSPPLIEMFEESLPEFKFGSLEVKSVGRLRKKYTKEANVFRVSIPKKGYLRKDYSLDLFKARQALSSELHRLLGGIRDFNGGILSKQQEVFQQLQSSLAEADRNNEFLLENFFYSLTPPLRQSLLLPSLLKTLFLMLLEALEHRYETTPFFLKAASDSNHLLIMAACPHPYFKEEMFAIVNRLQIPTSDLTYTYVDAHEIPSIGYIYQSPDPQKQELFYNSILNSVKEWHARLKK